MGRSFGRRRRLSSVPVQFRTRGRLSFRHAEGLVASYPWGKGVAATRARSRARGQASELEQLVNLSLLLCYARYACVTVSYTTCMAHRTVRTSVKLLWTSPYRYGRPIAGSWC